MVNFPDPRVVIQFICTDDLRYAHDCKYMLVLIHVFRQIYYFLDPNQQFEQGI